MNDVGSRLKSAQCCESSDSMAVNHIFNTGYFCGCRGGLLWHAKSTLIPGDRY